MKIHVIVGKKEAELSPINLIKSQKSEALHTLIQDLVHNDPFFDEKNLEIGISLDVNELEHAFEITANLVCGVSRRLEGEEL